MTSFQIQLPDDQEVFLRFHGEVMEEIRAAYDKAHRESNLTQSDVAQKLGVHKSRVHRLLNGDLNMTERTIAALAWALGCRPRLHLEAAKNHDVNRPLPQITEMPTLAVTTSSSGSSFTKVVPLSNEYPSPTAASSFSP